ncbi:MAG TPA: putative peptidoglycan glycosyltransferase FtsW [Candidatus Limnocylindrales bacterium]
MRRPTPRTGGRKVERRASARPTAAAKASAKRTLRREAHQPDYAILVATVALAATGILMVFSSSAMEAYQRQDDTFAIVGPQIQWALLGLVAMAITMRIDYRYLRLVSVPGYVVALVLLGLVLVLPERGVLHSIVVGGSARWIQLGSVPAIHPAEFAKLALIVYLAHWMARRGIAIRSFWRGTVPFLVIVAPVVALIFKEPDLGTTIVVAATALTIVFAAGANLIHLGVLMSGGLAALVVAGLRGYQSDRIRIWLDPWVDALGAGFQTVQGLLALGTGGIGGTGLGQSRIFVPNAFNDFIFAEIGQEFGLIGAVTIVVLFGLLGYAGVRTALRAPDTFGALLAAGITAWLCVQAFINMAVVVTLVPVTGITLPFISAGGSSLIISFAAVGILLSISRETVERGSWNDAPADRGRGHGRTHLPGTRRRSSAPVPAGRRA